MRRQTALKNFSEVLQNSDIAIFSGEDLCKEEYEFDRPGNLYIKESFGLAAAFALGVAMSTDKRVFVFVGEGDLIREFSTLAHIAVSKCKNIFVIILDNGVYQSATGTPTIFESIFSKKGVMHYMGLMVHDFTKHLQYKNYTEFRAAIDRVRGPMVILISVDKFLKKNLPDIEFDNQIEEFSKFVQKREETALFEPPSFVLAPNGDITSINMDEIAGGAG